VRVADLNLLEITSGVVASICNADDKHELRRAINASAGLLGFDSFNLGCEKRAQREFMTNPTLTNWSYDDLVAYERDGWSERDPLLEYAATGTGPLYWQRPTWKVRHDDYLEYIEHAGIFSGITIPMGGPSGMVGALTLLSFADREHDKDAVHAATIIGMVAKERARSLGLFSGDAPAVNGMLQSLSSLQREVLKWIANGKSNSEIAIIVGQSKRSVDYHVIEILKKLAVSSRAQAAAFYASL
jgi:DNA-binding CsgD family transcriptional regulator